MRTPVAVSCLLAACSGGSHPTATSPDAARPPDPAAPDAEAASPHGVQRWCVTPQAPNGREVGILDLAVGATGTIYLGGSYASSFSTGWYETLNPQGGVIDLSDLPSGFGAVSALVPVDHSVLVSGPLSTIKLDDHGVADPSYQSNGRIGTQPVMDGPKIIFTTLFGLERALDDTGAQDFGFGSNGKVAFATTSAMQAAGFAPSYSVAAPSVAVDLSGRIYVAGQVSARPTSDNPSGSYAILARYLADGQLDTGFADAGMYTRPQGGDLHVVLAGGTNGNDDFYMAYATGSGIELVHVTDAGPDPGFGGTGVVHLGDQAYAVGGIVMQADRSVVLAMMPMTGQPTASLVRVTPSGAVDPGYGIGGRVDTKRTVLPKLRLGSDGGVLVWQGSTGGTPVCDYSP
jgi:hypothetical protein